MFYKNKIFLAVFLAMQLLTSFAQLPLPLEKVVLTTDRTIYFAGEQIWLKAESWLTDRMEVPTDILTGNYYIRSYTQYMRNFERELYYTTKLTIINPELPSKEIIQVILKDSFNTIPDTASLIDIVTKISVVPPNSLVRIELSGEKNMHLSVNVVKKGSYEQQAVGIQTNYNPAATGDSIVKLKWFPEIRSINISGKLKSKKFKHSSCNFSIYNLLGRNNPYSIYFKQEGNRIKGYELSIFGSPIVSLACNFKLGSYEN